MKSYRDALKSRLSERVAMNPRYSLRAFARDVGLSPSYLSQVLNGTRGLTGKKAPQVFKRLAFSDIDLRLFELEMKKEHSRADKTKHTIQKQIDTALQSHTALTLAPERFELLSSWFAMTLLQLFYLKGAPVQSRDKFQKFAGQRLKLPIQVVKHTLTVFLELGLIKDAGKGYEALHTTVWTTSEIPSTAIRAFHKQMIEQALSSIELQRMDERSLQSLLLPVLREDIPKISNEILRFSNMLMRKYGKAETREGETVYGVNFQVFRLIEDETQKA
jgi:uncharacterized protein (TIGR02147 family)